MDELSRLISRAQQKDKEAYGNIYKLFYKRIYRYCLFNLRDRELAQDTCQETFLKAWKALPQFKLSKGGSFQAYLFRISRNLIIDFSRKKKAIRLEKYHDIQSENELSEEADKKTNIAKLKSAISKLKQEDKQIIILRYFEDLTLAEIAKAINTKEGAIRVRVHRITKKLKEVFENEI